MKKITKLSAFGIAMFLLCGLFLGTGFFVKNTKIGFVNNADLFAEFTGKKDNEQKLKQLEFQQKRILDSLAVQVRAVQNSEVKTSELQKRLEGRYLTMQEEFSVELENLSQKYTDEIWQHINQYVSDYGEEKGYDVIYGTTGNGGIMYGKKDLNLTPELLNYINLRYEGY